MLTHADVCRAHVACAAGELRHLDDGEAAGHVPDVLRHSHSRPRRRGAQFTCFTGTKVLSLLALLVTCTATLTVGLVGEVLG